MARVICQACGGRTEEGGFCEKCGAPLADGADGLAAGVDADPLDKGSTITAVPAPAAPRAVGGEALAAPRVIVYAQDKPSATAARVQAACPVPPAEAESAGFSEDFDDCPLLRVDRDSLAFCVSQTSGVMRLRIRAYADAVKNLRIDLHIPGVSGAFVPPVKWLFPRAGRPREFSLTIPPLREGAYAAELDLQFEHDARVHKFSAPLELYVYPAASSAKQIADSVVFNISNDIKMGHASDLHQSMDAAKVLEGFVKNGNGHGLQELLDVLKTDLRAFRRLCFNETCAIGLRHPPEDALADRLTLEVGGRLLHLIAGARVTFGRHRASRVVTRIFNPGEPVMAQSSLHISKHHCTVEMDGETCVILDGAADTSGVFKQSGGGVFWNGVAVDGSVRIPVDLLPRQAVLGFAGTAAAPCFTFTVAACRYDPARCARCEDRDTALCRRGRVPALALRRADPVPETFVLLWACLDLGRVAPELQGLTVCHERGGFSWRSGGEAGWFKPGRYQVVGTEVRVKAFQQYGL